MRNCWSFERQERPCFVELVQDISKHQQTQNSQLQNNTSTGYLKVQ